MSDPAAVPSAELVRLCLSGSALCAGLAPCEACRTALAQYVVPNALLKAGVDDQERVLAFFDGYNEARKMLIAEIAKAAAAQRPPPPTATDPLARPTQPSEPKAPAPAPEVIVEGTPKPSRRASLRPRPTAAARKAAPSPKTPAASAATEPSPRNGVDAAGPLPSTPETTGESSP